MAFKSRARGILRSAPPLSIVAAALLMVLLLLLASPTCRGQRPYPLPGADGPLEQEGGKIKPIEINTTVLLERVVDIDEKANGYSAIWWVIFSWRDANAGATVEASTAAAMQPNGNCTRWCDSGQLPTEGCCDGIWIPEIELPNLLYYSEDQQPRWRINVNATSGTVTWSTRLVGTWYAPLDYRAYPFDHQHMLLELAIADSQSPYAGLRWDHVAKLNNTAHTKGPDVSGWRMIWGKGKVYNSTKCFEKDNVTQPSYERPSSVAAKPPLAGYESVTMAHRYFAPRPTSIIASTPKDCGTYKRYDEALALYGPIVLVADVMMKRVASYYVLTNLIPVILITLVSFVVFFMPQDALGDRMSVVLTMMLSLTAMQFVFDFPPANYINALQMVVLVSYLMIAIACVECLIVNRIATVADAVSIKRTAVTKYAGLLSQGTFDRYLYRELLGRPAHGRPHRPSAAAAGFGKPLRPAHKSAMHGGGGGASKAVSIAGTSADRADSAMDGGQHVTINIPSSVAGPPGPATPARQQARPSRADRTRATTPAATTTTAAGTEGVAARKESVSTDAASRRASASAGGAGGDGALPPEIYLAAGGAAGAAAPHPLTGASPFASARTTASYAAPERQTTDVRSIGSTTASTAATAIRGFTGVLRRCCNLGLWPSLRAFLMAVLRWLVAVVTAPSRYYRQCKEDPRFARFVAGRIDKWSAIVSITLYIICISVLLWVETKVGDHKLMLGDVPGNM